MLFLQVILANDRRDGSVRDQKENEKLLRLFVKVPKSFEEKDLERVFSVSNNNVYIILVFVVGIK